MSTTVDTNCPPGWGHFLLLALNYSLFFGIVAVLGYRGSAALALGVGATVSLPLLTLHVTRITDSSFAIGRVLPLVVFTLGTVVAAVFLDRNRAFVFLGASVLMIGFLTLTYERWAETRKAHAEGQAQQRKREERWAKLQEAVNKLRELLDAQELPRSAALRALDDAPQGFDAERTELRKNLERHQSTVDEARSVAEVDVDLDGVSMETHARRCRDHHAAVEKAARLLKSRSESLRGATKALGGAARQELERLRKSMAALEGALGDAAAQELEAQGLLKKSTDKLPRERDEVEQALQRLAEGRGEAEGFREMEQRAEVNGNLRRRASDADRHARSVSALVAALRDAVERLQLSLRQALERERLEEDGGVAAHCLSCGQGLAPGSRFCANCGTPKPLEVECPACGRTTRLPTHLLRRKWRMKTIHCASCGGLVPAPESAERAGDSMTTAE